MLKPNEPALALAPMDGVTDAPMRAFQGSLGVFSYSVSEFVRVSAEVIPAKVFVKEIPELSNGGRTQTGLPVQVQILGGDPERMALSAMVAYQAGATAIDINFGCPAPTVNRHDGGASLLRSPCRIRDIVSAVREAVPIHVPVSAKLRLGWDNIDSIFENAEMAAQGGASWLTIHARTRVQGYQPPVYWPHIGKVRESLNIPVVANGDIWNFKDFLRCREETECEHFMIGRGALANPLLPYQIATELGISKQPIPSEIDWIPLLQAFAKRCDFYADRAGAITLMRLKQWLKLAKLFGDFPHFDAIKQTQSLEEFFEALELAFDSELLPA